MNSLHIDHARACTDYRTERLLADWRPRRPDEPTALQALLQRLRTRLRRRAAVAVAEVTAITEAAVAGAAELTETIAAGPEADDGVAA